MNAQIEITMHYYNLSTTVTDTVTKICNADLAKVNLISENIGGGKRQDSISGEVAVVDEYADFALYLNDSDYYVDFGSFNDQSGWSYNLWKDGTQFVTNQIKLVNNNIDSTELVFSLFGEIANEYTKVYADFEKEYNILDDVAVFATQFGYTDFRSTDISAPVVGAPVGISSQPVLESFVNTKIAEYEDKIPVLIALAGIHPLYIPTITYEKFEAIGYLNGTTNEPPAGTGWIYDAIVGGQPQFIKKPTLISVDYGAINAATSTITNTTVNVEQEANVTYSGGVSRRLDRIIQYLVESADSSIQFDGDSFTPFDDLVGETIGGSDKFLSAYTLLVTVSDMIPTLAGNQKNNDSVRGYISLAAIMEYLEPLGFFWYLEFSGGQYFYRLQHLKTKSLGSSNPEFTNYFGKDYTFRSQNLEIQESEFDILTNETLSSGYNFKEPTYEYRTGTKKKSIQSSRIVTDVNYVIDAKDSVFDATSGEQWVLIVTTFDAVDTYDIRQFTSDLNGVLTNNYELSFHWLADNLAGMPGKISKGDDVFVDSRVQKKQIVTINAPCNDPFTDFNFYDSISYYGKAAELQSITMPLKATGAEFKFKYL